MTHDLTEPGDGPPAHDVVIVGGGNAGISLAARLRRDGCDDVAVVDPVDVHRYRPLLSYVGGGQAAMASLERPQAEVIPAGVRWYQTTVRRVHPAARRVELSDGADLGYGDLVLCPGVSPDWDAVPGSRAAVFSAHGASNYVDERASHTWELVRSLRQGRALFVIDSGPVPCAGVGWKPLFLAADHWRRTGVLNQIEITAMTGWNEVFGLPEVDRSLQAAAARYGVTVITGAELLGIDHHRRTLSCALRDGGATELGYDLLHFVPRHRPPAWIADSGLSRSPDLPALDGHDGGTAGGALGWGPVTGMVDVSPTTLQHRRYPNIWGLGDAADVQASRSGGALRKQAAVVADNISRSRHGRPLVDYTGYSTAPITTSRRAALLAEYDRAGTITPSVPVIDLLRPRWLTWCYDRYVQPQLYWHSILKGRIRR